MEPQVESSSLEEYYASFEVAREPTDLTKTRKFKPKPDPVTTRYVRPEPEPEAHDKTVPFVKESSPYELLDLHEAVLAPVDDYDPTDVVEFVDIEELDLPDPADCSDAHESVAAASLISDTVQTTPDVIVRFQRSSTHLTRPRVPWLWITVVLVAAVALGIGVALLAF